MLWITKPYTKIACISDPHAHKKTLEALIAQIPPDYLIMILGDLIDKGDDARGVVEFVKSMGYDVILGNHDLFMTIESQPKMWKHYESAWINGNNGRDTIKSYGDKYKILKDRDSRTSFYQHVTYLRGLPLVIELPNLIVRGKPVLLSHSSIAPALTHFGSMDKLKEVLNTTPRQNLLGDYKEEWISTEAKIIQSILWTEVHDVDKLPDIGMFNVMGHTVQPNGIQIGQNGACIDCGVYKFDKMSALLLPDLTIIEQEAIPDKVKA